MKITSTFAAAAVLAAVITSTAASAQESKAPQSDQMMQGQDAMPGGMTGDMKGGDMSGMQDMMPMMKMMQQMAPMMEQCTEMMAAMTDQMRSAPNAQDDNG